MSDKSRYIDNTFPEYNGETLVGPDKKLTGKISSNIDHFLTSRLQQLQEVYEDAIERKRFDSSHDSSVYTGTSGIVLLAHKMKSSKWKDFLACQEILLTKISLHKKGITFLCGDAGPLVLNGLHCNSRNDEKEMGKCVKKLLKFASWSSEREMCNEVLYGRAGYLYALLRMKQVSVNVVPDGVIQQIVDDIIKDGIKGKENHYTSSLPLYYEWHDKEYIGAAHGYVGILYMLLQAHVICPGILTPTDEDLVVTCLDGLLKQQFASG